MPLVEEFEVQGNYLFKRRGVLPILILSAGIIVFLLTAGTSGIVSSSEYEIVCLLIALIGLGLRIFTVGFRAKGTSGRNTSKQIAESLNTRGMYSLVRHPLYLGNFFMSLGVALLIQSFWFTALFVLLYWIYYERIMFAEEQFLRKKFGTVYIEWAMQTPAIIPMFKKWISPVSSINWKVVLKNEGNCLLTLSVIFLLFECIEEIKHEKELRILTMWAFYWAIVSLLMYLFIKIKLKKNHVDKNVSLY